jgi:hypothetical protein
MAEGGGLKRPRPGEEKEGRVATTCFQKYA